MIVFATFTSTEAIERHDQVVAADLGLTRAGRVGVVAVGKQHVVEVTLPVRREVGQLVVVEIGPVDATRDHTVGVGHHLAVRERPTLAVVGHDVDARGAIGVGHGTIRERGREPRDCSRRRPVAVRAALGVVVEPVELEGEILLQRVEGHGREVEAGQRAESLVAVVDAVAVGVGDCRVGAGIAGVDEHSGVRLGPVR
jgi:hypothetical protein